MFKTSSQLIDAATRLVEILVNKGYESYFAGGCVRDMIMGVEPHDIDIATSAKPDEVMKIFKRTVPVGVQFGVVIALFKNYQFEVATFRKDKEYLDARHPLGVEFTDAKEDVLRRDFTINALLYNPLEKKILDYVDGKRDIEEKKIRTVGNPFKRFEEDKLRMLRAIRFAASLNFEIEDKTLEAIYELAYKISSISSERIRDELVKLLTSPKPAYGFTFFKDTRLMQYTFPEIYTLMDEECNCESNTRKSIFEHIQKMYVAGETLSESNRLSSHLSLAVFIYSYYLSKKYDDNTCRTLISKTCKGLRLSNQDSKAIRVIVENQKSIETIQNAAMSELKRFLRLPHIFEILELYRFDCIAAAKALDMWKYCMKKLEEFSEMELHPQILINGEDLIKLGYKTGPLFTKIFEFIENAQLENKLSDKQEAIEMVKMTFPLSL